MFSSPTFWCSANAAFEVLKKQVKDGEDDDGNRAGNAQCRGCNGHEFGFDAGCSEGAVDDAYRGASVLGDVIAVACDATGRCSAPLQGTGFTGAERRSSG